MKSYLVQYSWSQTPFQSIYKRTEIFSLLLSSGTTHRRVPNRGAPDTSLWNKPLPNSSSSPPQLPGHLIPKQAAIRLRTKWTKFAIKLNLLSRSSENVVRLNFSSDTSPTRALVRVEAVACLLNLTPYRFTCALQNVSRCMRLSRKGCWSKSTTE